MFRSGETLGLFTGNKGGHSEHFSKFSALYYFFSKPKIPGLIVKEINYVGEILTIVNRKKSIFLVL